MLRRPWLTFLALLLGGCTGHYQSNISLDCTPIAELADPVNAIRVTELRVDKEGAEMGVAEYFELYNPGPACVDVNWLMVITTETPGDLTISNAYINSPGAGSVELPGSNDATDYGLEPYVWIGDGCDMTRFGDEVPDGWINQDGCSGANEEGSLSVPSDTTTKTISFVITSSQKKIYEIQYSADLETDPALSWAVSGTGYDWPGDHPVWVAAWCLQQPSPAEPNDPCN